MISEADLHAWLSAVEIEEMKLLANGVVDAGFTGIEIQSILAQFGDSQKILKVLIDKGLVFSHQGLFRSRMAETVRGMRLLRQSFRQQKVTSGKPLVQDFRLIRQSRRRPRVDVSLDEFIQDLSDRPLVERSIVRLLSYDKMRRFQVDATIQVLNSLDSGERRAVVIAAGTGSGKTLAFYLPCFAMVAGKIESDESPFTKTLALYPRNELLKDQFAAVLKLALKVNSGGQIRRPITVGAWFGETPHHTNMAEIWNSDSTKDAIFPLSPCPACSDKLLWTASDRRAGIERLRCKSSKCSVVLDDSVIRLTRRSLKERPVDILFANSESLNRQLADESSFKAFGICSENPLAMVLLDEVHTYEGGSGAQHAYLFRRLAHAVRRPLTWVGLSATLANPRTFISQIVGVVEGAVEVVEPSNHDLESYGSEYSLMLKHDATQKTSPLSLTIQASMLLSRMLDKREMRHFSDPDSLGLFGRRIFLFTDKLDVFNRLYWNLLDAEGWSRPGKPHTLLPLSLASLRSRDQQTLDPNFRESSALRDPDGQWWWAAEQLGHIFGAVGKKVGRVSSQESTGVESSDMIVATSSLEVGYSDDSVGAVVQHKVPGSPARFIQRKGRAGRLIGMRPWTVVTVSEWGRDRLGWQLFDQTLDPQLVARNIPLRNRHIQKIQGVYSTLDWLASRLGGGRASVSSWMLLAGPVDAFKASGEAANIKQQQQLAAQYLKEVLSFGPLYDDWKSHIKESLQLDEKDYELLITSSPRPLLFGAIATMYRRLVTQWDGEKPTPDDRNVQYRIPMPDFAPSNLFSDLSSREVPVVVGRKNPRPGDVDRTEILPTVRVLREFLPGNISRHFGYEKSDRHWIPVSLSSGGTAIHHVSNPVTDYRSIKIGTVVSTSGQPIALYTPTHLNLSVVPLDDVTDGTSVSPEWKHEIEKVGNGVHVELDPSLTKTAIKSARAHLHANGDAARVRRFVLKGTGRVTRKNSTPNPIVVKFKVDDKESAFGYEYETDGIQFEIGLIADRPLSDAEILDFVREYFIETTDLSEELTYFDRVNLATMCEVVAAQMIFSHDKTGQSIANTLEAILVSSDISQLINLVDDDESLTSNIQSMLSDSQVLKVFSKMISVITRDVAVSASTWLQRRFAVTIGAALIDSILRLSPQVEAEDVQIDVDEEGRFIWLSEVTPGGNGHIEAIVRDMTEFPDVMGQIMRSQCVPGDLEQLGDSLEKAVRAIHSRPELRQLSQDVIDSWPLGQVAVATAIDALILELGSSGVTASPGLMTAMTSRFIGPGCDVKNIEVAVAFMNFEDQLSTDLGFVPELSIAQWIAVNTLRAVVTTVKPTVATDDDLLREIEIRSWPRHRNAARLDLVPQSIFDRLPSADRILLAEVLGHNDLIVDFADITPDQVRERLASEGEVNIAVDDKDASTLRNLIIDSQSHPIDVNGLFVYPKVSGIRIESGKRIVTLLIEEGSTWLG